MQTVVRGSISDEEGTDLEGCTVMFFHSDTVAGGAVTNKKGKFELKGLQPGEYECRVSMIGYEPASRRFTLSGSVTLPRFVLDKSATELEELTVTPGMRSKDLAGMSIYYLSSRAKKESDAYYALQEIPRLIVNPSDRTIKLDDGSTPLILVNGVKKPLDVLLPEMIASVEVIYNPSARYRGDASVSSVLNVRLKKEGIKSYFRANIGGKLTPNANFIYSNGSFELGTATSSLYLNGGYMQTRKMENESFSDTYQGDIHREENSKSAIWWRNPFILLGGDKQFNSKNYLAFDVKYYISPSSSWSKGKGQITDLAQELKSTLESRYDSRNKWHQLAGNLFYRHMFKSTRTLELTGSYYYSLSGNNSSREESSSFYNYASSIDLDNSRHMGELNINYSDMLTQSLHFEAGSNTEYSVTDIDDRLDMMENFRYRRTREYLYAGIDNNQSYNSKFNFSVSLGLDMVFSDAAGVRHSYVDVVPSASARYKFDGRNSLSIQYDRTRVMPTAAELNPLNTSTDGLTVNEGNPLLTPSHNDRFKFGYTFNGRGFRFNPYIQYLYRSKMIQPYGYLEGDIYVNTLQNLGHMSELQPGITMGYSIPQTKPYYGDVNLNLYYLKSYIKGMPFNGNSFYGELNFNFGYDPISFFIYLAYTPTAYTLYSKTNGTVVSNFQITLSLGNSWSVYLSAEKFLWPRMRYKTWTLNGGYTSLNSSMQTSLAPKVCLGFTYHFVTKNFRWRNKKQFYGEDGELKGISTK